MWTIYNELIEGISDQLVVEDMICGVFGTLVKTRTGIGFSLSLEGSTRPFSGKKVCGMKLKELAAYVKSWNFVEASLGQAAINAYYNAPEIAAAHGIRWSENRSAENRLQDPFITYQNKIRDKNVAVVGHFPYIEQLFAPVSNLSILETDPLEGDFPDNAAEYILPDCDFVFITGKSFINKSLPRYLKLCERADVIMVGPSTPLAPSLFQHNIIDLSGIVIHDEGTAIDACCGRSTPKIYRAAHKVSLKSAQ